MTREGEWAIGMHFAQNAPVSHRARVSSSLRISRQGSSTIWQAVRRLGTRCIGAIGLGGALYFLSAVPAAADPVGLQWAQPLGRGTPVYVTYSYSNLLDGTFLLTSPDELRAATEE